MSSGKGVNSEGENIDLESKLDQSKDEKSAIETLSNLVDNISLGSKKLDPDLENKNSEEEKCKKYVTTPQKNNVTIPEWLKDCETPFSWHLELEQGLGSDLVILRTLEKLDELFIEEPGFSLQRFVSFFKLVLEYCIAGDIDKCCEYIKTIDGCLEEEIAREDPMYQKVKLSLGHVVSATKAQVLYIKGNEEESKKIGRCIIPTKIMTDADKAALSSMKARFFLYSGYENGEAAGVSYAKKALELEPDNPEWEYLLAKMLRQQRRDVPFSTEVPRDELKLLESAVNRGKNSKYLVYLAQVYRECSVQAFRKYKNHPNFQEELQSSIENMAKKSLDYYKEALALNPDSPAVLRRTGYGIMNLPKKFADYDLALECLLKSLDISENQMTLHVLGTFYHRYRNDQKKALEYFEKTAKAGSWFGLSDMVRVKWILDLNYDPRPDLEIALSWKMKKNYRHQLLAQLGGYYLFIKHDFHKALEYFKQIILADKNAPQMTVFKSFFVQTDEPIDLYKYLANEALLLVKKNDSSSTLEPETSDEEEATTQSVAPVGYVEDFLDLISEVRPELMEVEPDEELIPRLLRSSQRKQSYFHRNSQRGGNFRSNYSDNRGRGRGFSGNRGGSWRATDGGDRREGERRGGGRGGFSRGTNQNWRPRPRRDQGGDNEKRDQENWRKK